MRHSNRLKPPSHQIMRVGRPKGKKYYPVSISLTKRQIEWSERQPNFSETIRRLLDEIMEAGKGTEESLSFLAAKREIDELERQIKEVDAEMWKYRREHESGMFEMETVDIHGQRCTNVKKDKEGNEVKLDTEKSAYHWKVFEKYRKAVLEMTAKLEKLKEQIMRS